METQELKLTYEELSELYYLVFSRIDEIGSLESTTLNRKYCLRLQNLQAKLINALEFFNSYEN